MSFNRLPLELRLEIWEHCLETHEDRYLILGIFLGRTMCHHYSSPDPEQFIVAGTFTPAWPNHAIPVHPVESQFMVKSLGALCYDSRALVLKRFPDLIRVERNTRVLAGASRLVHDRDARNSGGCRPRRLYLRCNLRTDILWAHSNAFDRRVHCYNSVDFALGVYGLVKDTPWGPVRADLFRDALRSVRHLVISTHLKQDRRYPYAPRVQQLLVGMPLLETLAIQEGRLPEPFRRIKEPGIHSDVVEAYFPLRYRFVSPNCYALPPSRIYSVVKALKPQGHADHDQAFRQRLRQELRLQLRLREHHLTVEALAQYDRQLGQQRVKGEIDGWRTERQHWRQHAERQIGMEESDGRSLLLPEPFIMVASNEEVAAHSEEDGMGLWTIR